MFLSSAAARSTLSTPIPYLEITLSSIALSITAVVKKSSPAIQPEHPESRGISSSSDSGFPVVLKTSSEAKARSFFMAGLFESGVKVVGVTSIFIFFYQVYAITIGSFYQFIFGAIFGET
jgi:hypothetical protein